ncbi:hypothetical protein [Nocardioides halotolerans]|jgi:hypothetical protein|uniref:hypothetical protein n=1 Tax=Nocardioides halotolerans TaxID=433660 RepID=UPI0012F91252|nr:hypothetical protein [Nocardioides halotolerans]
MDDAKSDEPWSATAGIPAESVVEAGRDREADEDGIGWTLVVHDGDGTWHAVSALRLVALRDDELTRLEDGDESVLDGLPHYSVLEALVAQHPDLAGNGWVWS